MVCYSLNVNIAFLDAIVNHGAVVGGGVCVLVNGEFNAVEVNICRDVSPWPWPW